MQPIGGHQPRRPVLRRLRRHRAVHRGRLGHALSGIWVADTSLGLAGHCQANPKMAVHALLRSDLLTSEQLMNEVSRSWVATALLIRKSMTSASSPAGTPFVYRYSVA